LSCGVEAGEWRPGGQGTGQDRQGSRSPFHGERDRARVPDLHTL